MAITFDKKEFKRRYKSLKLGREKYLIASSFFSTLFTTFFAGLLNYFLFNEKGFKSIIFISLFFFVFMFVAFYFINKSLWKQMKNDFNESIDYWEKHDPTFFDGEKFEKID